MWPIQHWIVVSARLFICWTIPHFEAETCPRSASVAANLCVLIGSLLTHLNATTGKFVKARRSTGRIGPGNAHLERRIAPDDGYRALANVAAHNKDAFDRHGS
jgi:hypothetical protein